MKAVRLKDVAARAGVSVSTASRVLDERLPASDSPTAQRVRAAAAELGYRKDAAASALRRGDTGTVGVLVPRLSDKVMALLFEEVYARAASLGLFAMVSVCGNEPEREQRALEALLARRVDGVVLAASRLDDDLPAALRRRRVPHVLAIRTDGRSPSAVCDDELGGYLAARHLIDLGHETIGILPGPDFTSTARQRLAGFRRAMEEAGLAVHEDLVHHCGFSCEDGRAAAGLLLDRRPTMTALFAANDQLALGALGAAGARGLAVPGRLSVVGYNDTPLASQLTPPLTTVRVPFDRVASDAVDLLIAQVHGAAPEDVGSRTAIPTLIPRRTTRAAR